MNAAIVPTPRRRLRFWLIWIAGWTALGVWLGVNVIVGRRNGGMPIAAWEPLTWELSSALVMALLCVAVYKFEQHWPLSGAARWRHLPLHVAGALVFSAVHTLGMVGIRKIVYAIAGS